MLGVSNSLLWTNCYNTPLILILLYLSGRGKAVYTVWSTVNTNHRYRAHESPLYLAVFTAEVSDIPNRSIRFLKRTCETWQHFKIKFMSNSPWPNKTLGWIYSSLHIIFRGQWIIGLYLLLYWLLLYRDGNESCLLFECVYVCYLCCSWYLELYVLQNTICNSFELVFLKSCVDS